MVNSPRIFIRPIDLEDAPALYNLAIDPRVNRTLLLVPSMELAETEAWVSERIPGMHRLVAEIDGRVVGSVSLRQPQNPRLVHAGKIGLMVNYDYWGQGVGSALMAAIIALADDWFHLLRLELDVMSNNPAAIHLYEKFGFVLEGTKRMVIFSDGRYEDEHVMARISPNPPENKQISLVQLPRRDDVQSISIRPVDSADARDLHEIFKHPLSARGTSQLPSQEFSMVKERTETQKPGIYRFSAVATHNDGSQKIVGTASLHQSQNPRMVHKASLGIAVHPEYWGFGIATQLLEKIVDLADNWLGLLRIELEVATDNPAAIQLYRKFDFLMEGTKRLYIYGDGRWADAHFMARIKTRAE